MVFTNKEGKNKRWLAVKIEYHWRMATRLRRRMQKQVEQNVPYSLPALTRRSQKVHMHIARAVSLQKAYESSAPAAQNRAGQIRQAT